MYLIPKNIAAKKKAHLWDDVDTYCKMYSTGGLRKNKYQLVENKKDREVCQMCINVFKQFNPGSPDSY